MAVRFASRNVVIAAEGLKPAAFTERRLIGKQVVTVDELDASTIGNNVYLPVMVKVDVPAFELLVLPDRIQFTLRDDTPGLLVAERIERLVADNPGLTYRAVGLNFQAVFGLLSKSVPALSRDLFFNSNSNFFRAADSSEALFGSMIIRSVLGARLQVAVTPVMDDPNGSSLESKGIGMDANFQFTLGPAVKSEIQAVMSNWESAEAMASEFANSLEEANRNAS